uniref:Odorant receptor n=1 Tax=Campoletis chlorideae TaxID=219166 RepID=A0A346D3V0_9HYME|nr:odorant receptor [Campoletis chlorideae]
MSFLIYEKKNGSLLATKRNEYLLRSSLLRMRKNLRNDFAPRLQSRLELCSCRTMDRNDIAIDSAICRSIKNKNYDSNIKRTLQYVRLFFTVSGVWPAITKYSSERSKYLSRLVILACFSMIAFTLVPTASHMIFREKNYAVKVVLLGPVGTAFGAMLKYAIILSRANTIKKCMEQMRNDWMIVESADEHAIMTNNANTGRKIAVICAFFLYTAGVSFFAIVPILKGSKINEFNQTIRPLAYPGYNIFIDEQRTPTYEIIFFLIFVSACIRYTITIGIISLVAAFVGHACGQIEIVMSRLNKLFDGINEYVDKDELRERMAQIIKCHVNGFRFSANIDESFREACFVEIMSSTLTICLLEYSCMWAFFNKDTMSVITHVLLLVSYVFNVFIFCHIGELLQTQYETVGNAAYMIEWYRLPDKLGLALVMVMAITGSPRKLTAGRMLDLSIRNFGVIIRTSVTYLNMLRATTT